MFIMFSLQLLDRLLPDVDIVLNPHGDGVVQHPGHGGHHPAYLSVSQDHPCQVSPNISAASYSRQINYVCIVRTPTMEERNAC